MNLRIIFFMLFILSSGIFHTVVPASLGKTRAVLVSTRHSRPKRCSCATFLDKECVYFCHLDIIWVNTPERTVSYGLGNAPRKRRSAQEMSRAAERPRCECTDHADGTCTSFCHTHSPQRREVARDTVFSAAGGHDCAGKNCILDLTAKTSWIKSDHKRDKSSVTRATRWLQQLLKKQRRLAHSKQNLAAEKGTS